MSSFGVQDMSGVHTSKRHATATYCCILNRSGECMHGVGNFDIHSQVSPELVRMKDF